MKVAYIDHPCEKSQKDKLVAEGYKVVDSRFKPAELKEGDIYASEKKKATKARLSRNRDK